MDATNAATTREERAAKIGDFIRRRRVALGMSQAELGRAIGKNQTWASQRECGYGTVRGEDVEPLAAALRVNPAELRLPGRPPAGAR